MITLDQTFAAYRVGMAEAINLIKEPDIRRRIPYTRSSKDIIEEITWMIRKKVWVTVTEAHCRYLGALFIMNALRSIGIYDRTRISCVSVLRHVNLLSASLTHMQPAGPFALDETFPGIHSEKDLPETVYVEEDSFRGHSMGCSVPEHVCSICDQESNEPDDDLDHLVYDEDEELIPSIFTRESDGY